MIRASSESWWVGLSRNSKRQLTSLWMNSLQNWLMQRHRKDLICSPKNRKLLFWNRSQSWLKIAFLRGRWKDRLLMMTTNTQESKFLCISHCHLPIYTTILTPPFFQLHSCEFWKERNDHRIAYMVVHYPDFFKEMYHCSGCERKGIVSKDKLNILKALLLDSRLSVSICLWQKRHLGERVEQWTKLHIVVCKIIIYVAIFFYSLFSMCMIVYIEI